MNIYAIEVIIRGTLFLKTRNLGKARYILNNLSTKTIDGTDTDWFSSTPFGRRPKVSFANELTIVGTIPNSVPVLVSEQAVILAREPFFDGHAWCIIHKSDDKIDGQWPVFGVPVDLTGTVLVRAKSVEQALQAVGAKCKFNAEKEWMSNNPEAPLVPEKPEASLLLAGRLYLVGPSDCQKLGQVWPDEPYPAINEIPLTLSDEFHYLPA